MENNDVGYQNLLRAMREYSSAHPQGLPQITSLFLNHLQKENSDAYYDLLKSHFAGFLKECNVPGTFAGLVRILTLETDSTQGELLDAINKSLRIAQKGHEWATDISKQ